MRNHPCSVTILSLLLVLALGACNSGDGNPIVADVSGSVDGEAELIGEVQSADKSCQPACDGRECGTDGCDGSCGECEEGYCTEEGMCKPLACTPGETLCVEGGVATCLEDGSAWSAAEPCASTEECVDGQCVDKPVCEAGETKCEGNGVTTCVEDGTGWSVAKACALETSCDGGVCVPWAQDDCAPLLDCMLELTCTDGAVGCVEGCWQNALVGLQKVLAETFWCVQEACGSWNPTSECFFEAQVDLCEPLFLACTGQCIPVCEGKECGDDGCGMPCGECQEGFFCDPNSKCLCEPQCEGKDCGPNGCGALCGLCGLGKVCNDDGLCVKEEFTCANDVCEPEEGENCKSCPKDCGECPPCGDGLCEEGEACDLCPADCGACQFGECCETHDFPGCEDGTIVECVCAIEEDCCTKSWLNSCVQLAGDCGADC